MVIQAPRCFVAITGASALGVLTVGSGKAAPVYPGAIGWVQKDDKSVASALVKVLSVDETANTITVRRFKDDVESATPQYGRSSMSAYATGCHLCLDAQIVPANPSHSKLSVA